MSDFHFIYPLWLLLAIPLAVLYLLIKTRKSSHGLIASHLRSENTKKPSTIIHRLFLLCWLIAVIALAGPSWQKQSIPTFNVSAARVIVMDMSMSMYATDIKPNRLHQSRYKALDLLPKFTEGSTGLIAYAGDAYTVSPLTEDSHTLSNLIPNISPEIMPFLGSNTSSAIELSIAMMSKAGHSSGDIILFTDGVSDKEASKINSLLANSKWRLNILAVGTVAGSPITLPTGKLLESGGVTVIAKTNFQKLSGLAAQSGGYFSPLTIDNSDIVTLNEFSQPSALSATNSSDTQISEFINSGYWLLIPLLIVGLLVFRKGVFIALLITVLPYQHAEASIWNNQNSNAHQAYLDGDYQQAAQEFTDPAWQGIANYQAGNFEAAIENLSGLEGVSSHYNLANALAQNGNLEQAKTIYQKLLASNPQAEDIAKNLKIVNDALKQQEQQEQQEQNKESKGDEQQSDKKSDGAENNSSSDSNSKDTSKQAEPQDQSKQKTPKPDSDKSDDVDKSEAQTRTKKSEPSGNTDNKNDNKAEPIATQQAGTTSSISESDPVMKKLETIPDDASRLLRAQLYLQAQERGNITSNQPQQPW